ncbi:unnamed protein product [Brachionus calyciflorus]|uniref:CBM1 domain-containing protein n=1 Tax=Brachionus calyciflorus TaxID=104777 RepID=A0A814CID0_9BILA|nr:unnamed protein product [Brachionus calyciflorus]
MLKILVLTAIICLARAQQKLYSQCGGIGWTGPTTCADGLTCQYQNPYYSQCLAGGSGTTTGATVTTQSSGTTGTLPSSGGDSQFPGGQFKHGLAWDGVFNDNDYQRYDYISIWINSPWSDKPSVTDFNQYWHGVMINKCKQYKKLPVYYAYVIAFEARAKFGFQDCDVHPTNNLCHGGANFIRQNRALLVSRYAHWASETAKALGDRNAPIVWLIEPDFWQYYGDSTQQGGPLSGEYMRALFDDFAKEIKSQLPNAKISWDLSAWIREDGMTKWWGYFKTSPYIDFVHTSGGQGQAGSAEYKPGELKWSDFSRITGKRIIADCGYGIGGGLSNNCGVWNLDNKKARIANGVIALTAAQGASQQQPNLERLPLP